MLDLVSGRFDERKPNIRDGRKAASYLKEKLEE